MFCFLFIFSPAMLKRTLVYQDVGLDVSCLFVAAKMGHMHLCAHLIQSEWFKTFPGEINGVDQTWKASALHAAASAGHLKVVKRLVLDWGADTEILDEVIGAGSRLLAPLHHYCLCLDVFSFFFFFFVVFV